MGKVRALVLVLGIGLGACLSTSLVAAQDSDAAKGPPPRPAGALSRAFLGDWLEKHKIMLFGWSELSGVVSTNDSGDVSPAAFFNTQRGINLNQIGLTLCSGRACPPFSFGPASAIHNRIGPFPTPKSRRFSIDFNVTAMYGQDIQFLKLKGLDGDFNFDRDSVRKFAIPQAFLDIYVPLLGGTSVIVGSFQTPLGNDIGYPYNPPNWFVTHTYAFQHGPAKHVGALAETALPALPGGSRLAVDYGVVLGWNDWADRNGNLDVLGGLRWRSADMHTWADLEAIYGDGNNDFGPAAGRGGAPYFALSSKGKYLGRLSTFLTVSHIFSTHFQAALEASYGQQAAGDVKVTPFAVTETARWYGANLGARYALNNQIAFNGRAEWFRDEKGAHALWAGVSGSVYAITANAEWQAIAALRLRAEARYDVHAGPGELFDHYTKDDQFTGLLDAFVLF